MSFYIKSFGITPRALEMKNAIPDGTPFSIETEIVCRKNSNHDAYYFTYYVGEKVIAESSMNCSQADEDHVIKDSLNITSDRWGNGAQSNIAVKVSVIQESSGAQLDNITSTWIDS